MTYGLNRGPFIGNGPAIHPATAAARTSARFRNWKALDEERRLKAVDQALKAPANDLIDNYPLAL